MRIRRRLSGHDQITALAAERDAALRARDAWKRMAQGDASQSTSEPPCGSDVAPYLDDSHVSLNATEAWDTPTRSGLRDFPWEAVIKIVIVILMLGAFVVLVFAVTGRFKEVSSAEAEELLLMQANTVELQQETITIQQDSMNKLRAAVIRLEEAMRVTKQEMEDARKRTQQISAGAFPPEVTTVVCDGPSLDCGDRFHEYQGQGQRQFDGSRDSMSNTTNTQLDVRTRTRSGSFGYPGGSHVEQRVTVSPGVLPVRKNVLPEMREDR